ncbi:hypothetical protein ACO0M4_15840 [Streptomyces sp. RGM 3693]
MSCLLPEHFTGRTHGVTTDFRHAYPAALQRKVLDNWADYGFATPGRPAR